MRRVYVLQCLEKRYPLLDDVHDRQIFKTPTPIDNFLHIAIKYMTPIELQGARTSKYYGDIRYKPRAAAPTSASTSEEEALPPEPAPSTSAPAAADSSSDSEEEVLHVLASDKSDGQDRSSSHTGQISETCRAVQTTGTKRKRNRSLWHQGSSRKRLRRHQRS